MENNIKNSVIKNYQKSKEMVSNAQEKGSTYYKEKSHELKQKALKPFDDLTSLPTSIWNKIFKRYRISDFLPYAFYNDKEKIFRNNDNTYGSVFQISPRIKTGEATAVTLREIIDRLPEGVFLQFMLFGSKNLNNQINFWEQEHLKRGIAEKDEFLMNAVSSMSDFYRSKTKNPLSKSMITMAKNYTIIISLKSENKGKLLTFKRDVKNIFESNNYYPIELTPQNLKIFLYEIFNPEHDLNNIPNYDENMYLSRQLIAPNTPFAVKDTHLEIDTKSWISLGLQSLPKEFHISDFGEKIGDTLSSALDSNQFVDTFFITSSIYLLPQKKTKEASRNHTFNIQQKWSEAIFREFVAVRQESLGIIDRIDQKKERLYAFDLNVLISGKDYEQASENADRIISYWNKGGDQGIIMGKALGIHQLNFLASLPMGINEEYLFTLTKKYRSLFSEQIAQFIALEADYAGNSPNLVFYSRRGQMAGLDLFVSNTNYNGFVVATSGAGKSVLLNMLAFNSYARGDRVFIMDYDNSFFKLCETLQGQYLELNLEKPISFNPFSEIHSKEELKSDLVYLGSLIYMMGASKNIDHSEKHEKLITSKLHEIVERLYDEIGEKMEITNIRDEIKTIEDQRFQDFANQLRPFCREGIYGKFFSGKCDFNIKKEFIVTEFKAMDNTPDLRDTLIMLMIYHLNQLVYMGGSNETRTTVIIDEAHKFLGRNILMDEMIEQGYRRFRKYSASAILATQGFNDVYNIESKSLSKAGSAIINNSAWKVFMKQTEVSANALLKSQLFSFTQIEENIIKNISTKKGEYSELMLISPEEVKVPYRLIMDRFFYYVTTTDPNDKKRIQKLVDSGVPLGEAIRQLVKEDENAS
ncbi:TraC family protein [Helicobacter pullorum]|uniref:TraC family protein n=1 Tax=Helicobacter pullorum TaxID=35818 RepID=UPI001F0E0DAB|nr:TraC family protein [Helicobacter pullorum]